MPEALAAAATTSPDRAAVVHGEHRISYAALARRVDDVAAGLEAAGVNPGDVVVTTLPSSIDFVVCVAAAMRIGAVATAINPRLGDRERSSILRRCESRVVIDSAQTLAALERADGRSPSSPLPRPDDLACIVWTSGTTGDPKGAMYAHRQLTAITAAMGELTRSHDVRIVALPFAHVGFMTRMHDEFANATTLVIATEPWRAGDYLEALERERVTVATGVPTQWKLILAHPSFETTDHSSLRMAGIGAAAIDPELIREMRDRLGVPVMARFTSTEAGIGTGTRLSDPPEVTATTVGRPAPGVDLVLAEPDGEGVGEILLRSDCVMRGYWRDPVLTATVIDAEGFLHTGDLGRVGDDGNLRIVGRHKEMYIRGGYNVYPAEVEHALAEHPAVAAVAVVGVPTDVLGEVGVAYVVVSENSTPPTLDELREFARARIADYKAPDRLEVVPALPLTPMGKVDKRALATPITAEESP